MGTNEAWNQHSGNQGWGSQSAAQRGDNHWPSLLQPILSLPLSSAEAPQPIRKFLLVLDLDTCLISNLAATCVKKRNRCVNCLWVRFILLDNFVFYCFGTGRVAIQREHLRKPQRSPANLHPHFTPDKPLAQGRWTFGVSLVCPSCFANWGWPARTTQAAVGLKWLHIAELCSIQPTGDCILRLSCEKFLVVFDQYLSFNSYKKRIPFFIARWGTDGLVSLIHFHLFPCFLITSTRFMFISSPNWNETKEGCMKTYFSNIIL